MSRAFLGHITRGKTARNRLRHTDHFLLAQFPQLIARCDGAFQHALYVDLGYGASPMTTLESAERLRQLNPHLSVLGVEIDPERVAAAQPFQTPLTQFRFGGFQLPLKPFESVRLIRAFNVLRQYDEHQVQPVYAQLCANLLPGGVLFEGTSDPFGRIWVANLLRRAQHENAWQHKGLVFGFRGRSTFDPTDFQTILPKNLIHRVVPGEPIYQFFQHWQQAAHTQYGVRVWGQRQWFVASARQLAQYGYDLCLNPRYLRRGWLLVRGLL